MDLKTISGKIQLAFDWLKDSLEPVETRWIVFLTFVGLIFLFKAAGAAGLSLLLALIYIMYFVTIRL